MEKGTDKQRLDADVRAKCGLCSEVAIRIGKQQARRMFKRRGNKREIHLSEAQLGAACAIAAELMLLY